MKITSPLFVNEGGYPSQFTCDGGDRNPPLDIGEVPKKSKSLALILRDPDAVEGIFIHWVVWNIDPKTDRIEIDSVPKGAAAGMTTNGKNHYVGPCPPNGTHRYIFTLYALDTRLNLPATATAEDLNAAMNGHIADEAELTAVYR
jgi:Raf kinase inhibitor-like YbhB/YbcL family protein